LISYAIIERLILKADTRCPVDPYQIKGAWQLPKKLSLQRSQYGAGYFFTFEITTSTSTMTRPTRKNAHHIPALKIVSTAPQLLKAIIVNKSRNKVL
jgi:hypothetical protein